MARTVKENETRKRIIEAARKLFSEKGFEGVSMEDIAQASGVRKSLIYYYFPSKEVLFEEIWIQIIDELENELFAESESDGNITRMIKRIIRKYIDFVMNKEELSKLIARERLNVMESKSQLERAKIKYSGFLKRLEALFERGREANVLNDIEPSTATELVTTVSAVHRKGILRNIEEFLLKVLLKERPEH
ncbi:TetR/AcrR family transcriptional regulator [Fervidobacterium thailandense]|uniref:TetR family transcriptional regulator n=1 Tax=Fervidobacterium thailandense TaxID=1008305 RepID=A0A1E3G4B1_9BACT|nr:TetR/AcrR family transcriptional regulator [Fervidobacterium thailandense]ODN31012.1 TetR family transcriptional regulator [Fervidobacterium thailandense]